MATDRDGCASSLIEMDVLRLSSEAFRTMPHERLRTLLADPRLDASKLGSSSALLVSGMVQWLGNQPPSPPAPPAVPSASPRSYSYQPPPPVLAVPATGASVLPPPRPPPPAPPAPPGNRVPAGVLPCAPPPPPA